MLCSPSATASQRITHHIGDHNAAFIILIGDDTLRALRSVFATAYTSFFFPGKVELKEFAYGRHRRLLGFVQKSYFGRNEPCGSQS